MKNFFGFFRTFLFLIIAAFSINIITWLIIYFKIRPSSEMVALHYNVFYGIDQAGKGYYLYIYPGIALLILLADLVLYRYFRNSQNFASKILVSSGLVVQILVLFAILFLKSIII